MFKKIFLGGISHIFFRKNFSAQIPKVASSSWSRNFMVMGGLRPRKKNHVTASRLFRPLMDEKK